MNQCIGGAREIEVELKRRVAYLTGGKDRAGVPIIVVPVGANSTGLCRRTDSQESQRAPKNHQHNESFDSDINHPTRDEEGLCQDLDRVLRYLHSVVR